MQDILKTYCKVPRGFVKAKGRAEQTRCTHVKCEIMYEWVSAGMPYCWAAEARQTIEAFEREFGVKIREWEYSSCGYDFHLDTGSIDDAVLALKGNRARAWFWNNHGSVLLEPRVRYFTHDREGRRIEAVAVDSVKYRSKIAFTRVYDGTCPWTGYCLDNDALDPIAYFCFGVEWDEKGKRRVQSKARTLRQDDANTVESLPALSSVPVSA